MSGAVSPDAVLLQCDGCASVAHEDLITERVPVGEDLLIDPLRAYSIVGSPLRSLPPEETRTERLVRSMLDVSNMDNHTPRALVLFARAIESELDRCCAPHPEESRSAPSLPLRPRNFRTDFLLPARNRAAALGAGRRVTDDLLPLVLDIAIAYGALEALTGNESLSSAVPVDAAYWEKVQRLARWTV
jgi:hypothetical protein